MTSSQALNDEGLGLDELSLDSDNTSTNKVFAYAPAALIDLTLHYQGASYHLHALLLVTKCKYFEALINCDTDVNTKCDQTERCKCPNNRCIAIEGTSIGGVSISNVALHQFFVELYAEAHLSDNRPLMIQHMRNSLDWRKRVANNDFVDLLRQGSWHRARVASYQNGNQTVSLRLEGHSASFSISINSPCFMMPYTQNIGPTDDTEESLQLLMDIVLQEQASVPTSALLSDLPTYHLSNFFDCASLSLQHDKKNRDIARKAAVVKDYSLLWHLLVRADRYHWKATRSTCIDALICDKECYTRPEWATHQSLLSRESLSELFTGAIRRT